MTTFFATFAVALILFALGYTILWFIERFFFDQDPWQF